MKLSINSSTSFQLFSQICLHCDEELFFLHCSVTDSSFLDHLIVQIKNFLNPSLDISYHIIPDSPLDYLIKEKSYLDFTYNNERHCIVIPIEFLNFLALENKMIVHSCLTIEEFYKEIFRFQPQLIRESLWLSLPEKDISDLFNYMLSKGLVSTQMLAIFFQASPLRSPQIYFSKRIALEIQQELEKLQHSNSDLLASIVYIIERNILQVFQAKNIKSLQQEFYLSHLVQNYFLIKASREFLFSSLKCIRKFDLYQLSNKIPYPALISLLKISSKDNLEFIKAGFSKEGQIKLYQDIQEMPVSVTKLREFFKVISFFEAQAISDSCDDLMAKYLQASRDFELLFREMGLKAFCQILDVFPNKKLLSGALSSFYYFYIKNNIVIPTFPAISLQDSFQQGKEQILYLKFLGFINS